MEIMVKRHAELAEIASNLMTKIEFKANFIDSNKKHY